MLFSQNNKGSWIWIEIHIQRIKLICSQVITQVLAHGIQAAAPAESQHIQKEAEYLIHSSDNCAQEVFS